jgi:hypothetical protein
MYSMLYWQYLYIYIDCLLIDCIFQYQQQSLIILHERSRLAH